MISSFLLILYPGLMVSIIYKVYKENTIANQIAYQHTIHFTLLNLITASIYPADGR